MFIGVVKHEIFPYFNFVFNTPPLEWNLMPFLDADKIPAKLGTSVFGRIADDPWYREGKGGGCVLVWEEEEEVVGLA